MLEAPDVTTIETVDAVLVPRKEFERLQGELKFRQARIEALNFEIARLKRWRFGSSSESLATSGQAVLFDAILADTELEEQAAREEIKQPAAARAPKGKAIRQALPASLPRIERRHEIEQTHCSCGQPLKRIGEEMSEQLDCVPAQFFVLRHIRGKYACACCQTLQAAPMPAQMSRQGDSRCRPAGAGGGGQARRPPAFVPPAGDLRALGRAHRALEHGAVGRYLRGAAGAAG